jgi:hypothetical protein
MIAALTDDHRYLTVAVVNATEQEHTFDLNVADEKIGGLSAAWQLSGGDLDVDNHVGQAQQIFVKQLPSGGSAGAIAVLPSSVTIYQFALQ